MLSLTPKPRYDSSRSEVNKIYIFMVEDARAVAWQQCNKASMTPYKRMVETPVVEHGKQNGGRQRYVNHRKDLL